MNYTSNLVGTDFIWKILEGFLILPETKEVAFGKQVVVGDGRQIIQVDKHYSGLLHLV